MCTGHHGELGTPHCIYYISSTLIGNKLWLRCAACSPPQLGVVIAVLKRHERDGIRGRLEDGPRTSSWRNWVTIRRSRPSPDPGRGRRPGWWLTARAASMQGQAALPLWGLWAAVPRPRPGPSAETSETRLAVGRSRPSRGDLARPASRIPESARAASSRGGPRGGRYSDRRSRRARADRGRHGLALTKPKFPGQGDPS